MLFFGVPLFFVSVTYQGIAFEKQYYFYAWTFLGIVAIVVRGMLGAQTIVRRTPLDIPLAVLWCAVAISTVFSVDRYHSVFGFLGTPVAGVVSLTALIAAYYMIVSTVTRWRVMALWWAVVASGALVTIWSFLVVMRMVSQKWLAVVPNSLAGNFSGLALYMAMLLPFFILTPFVIKAKYPKITMAIAAVLTVVNCVTLSAFYGYVQWYVVIGIMGLLVVFAISRLLPSIQKSAGATIGVFLVLIFLFLWGQPLVSRVTIPPEPMLTPALSWAVAKGALTQRPLTGSGPGMYAHAFSLHAPQELNKDGNYDTRAFTGRGMIADGIATVGVIGVIAVCIVLFTYIGTIWTTIVRDKNDDATYVAALGFFIASLMAVVYSALWAIDGMIIIYGAILAAACVGSIYVASGDRSAKLWSLTFTSSPQHALSFAFLSIVAAVLALFGFVTLGKMFMADVYVRNAIAQYQRDDGNGGMAFFQKAAHLNSREGRYYTLVAQYGLEQATREASKPTDQQNRDAIATSITTAAGAARLGADLMPNDVLAHEVKGLVLENSGGYVQGAANEAMAAYQRASALEPRNPQLDLAIGRMYLAQTQAMTGEQAEQERKTAVENAKKYFETAKDKTTFTYGNDTVSLLAPAHYYRAIVDEALGDMNGAIDAMKTALAVSQATTTATSSPTAQTQQINYAFHLSRMLQARDGDGDRADAEKILQYIISVRSDDVNARVALGLLYEKNDQKDKAREQYEHVLTLVPESDTQSRETVQKMLTTIAQGGNNTTVPTDDSEAQQQPPAETAPIEQPAPPTAEASTLAKPRVVIVHDDASAADAGESNALLLQNGYGVEVRGSENASTGVTIMYRDDARQGAAEELAQILRAQFPDATVMRNDAVMASYADFDILVDMGRE